MLNRKFKALLSTLLAVAMISSSFAFPVFADDTEEDGLVCVSVDLSDYLLKAGAIPSSNVYDDLQSIVPEYVSGDYDLYLATYGDGAVQKGVQQPDNEDGVVEDDSILEDEPIAEDEDEIIEFAPSGETEGEE